MTFHREWFHLYKPISRGLVYKGNDHALEMVDIGSIKVKIDDGMIHTILEVQHMKGLKNNLLSMR